MQGIENRKDRGSQRLSFPMRPSLDARELNEDNGIREEEEIVTKPNGYQMAH